MGFGFWLQDNGKMFGAGSWVLGVGSWKLEDGCRVLGAGCWVLGFGFWVLFNTILSADDCFGKY
ncbi:hypothetical protein [Dokdonia sinensis]|uniref:hypothetical protein n=1 Tax=Dokdonia sinensis TaxID=2479847 RepID=UPI001374AB06|nr:hypothetical protein [Dokdonia sinensis]